MTAEHDEPDRERQPEDREVPQHPDSRPAETVDALEDQHSDGTLDDGERLTGDDVSQNPESDEMEGLPGPPEGEAGEPAG